MNLLLKEMFCVVFYTNRTYKYFESVEQAKRLNHVYVPLAVWCKEGGICSSPETIGKDVPPTNIKYEQFAELLKKLADKTDSLFRTLLDLKEGEVIPLEKVHALCDFATCLNYVTEK
jgi:hypothetical protein